MLKYAAHILVLMSTSYNAVSFRNFTMMTTWHPTRVNKINENSDVKCKHQLQLLHIVRTTRQLIYITACTLCQKSPHNLIYYY